MSDHVRIHFCNASSRACLKSCHLGLCVSFHKNATLQENGKETFFGACNLWTSLDNETIQLPNMHVN